MVKMNHIIKTLSLECLSPVTVLDTSRNSEIFGELEKLDVEYKNCSTRAEKIPILARVWDLVIIMDVI